MQFFTVSPATLPDSHFNCTRLDQFSRSAHDRTRFRPAAYGLTDRVDALTTNLRIESPIGLSTGVRRRTLSYDQPSESFCPKRRGTGRAGQTRSSSLKGITFAPCLPCRR